MHKGCHLVILGDLVEKVASKEQWIHYCRMLARAFAEKNSSTYSICPNDKCTRVAITKGSGGNVVECPCGQVYCFKCTMAPHIPVSCGDLEKWKAKDSDDEMTVNFIKATTCLCPQCGVGIDRTTACNHITCKCGCRFCFVCKSVPWCGAYQCNKFKNVEEQQKAGKKFADGFATSSEWLVSHERYVAFCKKYTENKSLADNAEGKLREEIKKKVLQYYELKPGGNPDFMNLGIATLIKSYRIVQYTLVWGFWHIPATVCPAKLMFEMQIKDWEKTNSDLEECLKQPAGIIDQLKTKRTYQILEKLIASVAETDDLMAKFSEKKTGEVGPTTLGRWTCECNYSNHPVEQATSCGYCRKARPVIQATWFS